MLLVEETLANAQDIADYVYLMDTGRIVHEGTMAEFGDDVLASTYLGNQRELTHGDFAYKPSSAASSSARSTRS